MKTIKRDLILFLSITFVLSFAFEFYIIHKGGIRSWPQSTFFLMWIPGIVSILYRLISRCGFKDTGFKIGAFRYWFLAFAVPLFIALISNILCWGLGVNEFTSYPETILKKVGISSVGMLIAMKFPWWLLWGNINALGEELGWRGFLIPKLTQVNLKHPFFVSGLIWAAWHFPLIIWGDYATSDLPILSVLLFTVMIVCSGIFIAWLRMESGSVWVAMFYHACHNFFLQTAFAIFSKAGKYDPYLGNESGLFPCLIYIAVLLVGKQFIVNKRKISSPEFAI